MLSSHTGKLKLGINIYKMRGLLSLFLLAANIAVEVDSVNNTSNKPISVWNFKCSINFIQDVVMVSLEVSILEGGCFWSPG